MFCMVPYTPYSVPTGRIKDFSLGEAYSELDIVRQKTFVKTKELVPLENHDILSKERMCY